MSIERLRAIASDPDVVERDYAQEILAAANKIESNAKVIANLRARLVQIRGFASVMAENNWRDLQLHIERQTDVVEQTAPVSEIEPHAYVPSAMHMGDCRICGHLQGAPHHSPFRQR